MNHFTEQELQTLSAEIEQQLNELANNQPDVGVSKAVKGHGKKIVPRKQKQQLEQATGENADSFLKTFARAAKKDLCEEGGLLHEQFEKLGDLSNKSMLVTFGGVLAGMNVATVALPAVAVTVSVIVIHIGIKAFCEDCE
jgi:hypothetical protein